MQQRKAPLVAGLELGGECWPIPPSYISGDMRSNCDHSFGYPRFGLVQLCGSCSERGRYVPAIFWAFASLQLMTSLAASRTIANVNPPGHSTNYGSGHLIRVFRDIGRIFSLLVLLSACWSPAESKGSNAEDEIWFRGRQKRFQFVFRAELARVEEPGRAIRQNENPARFPRAGSREPLMHGV